MPASLKETAEDSCGFFLRGFLSDVLLTHGGFRLTGRSRRFRGWLRLAISNQGMNVLYRQSRISRVEPDGSAVRPRRKVNELLKVLSAGRRRRPLGEFEYEIKHLSDVLGEIGNVGVERAVIDGEETDLVVLQRHELGKVRRPDFVQIFGCPASSREQE